MNENIIVIGSINPVKVASVRKAVSQLGKLSYYKIVECDAPSGVCEQPLDVEVVIKGARNRITFCREKYPTAEIYVGIESGIRYKKMLEKYFDFSYTIIHCKNGKEFCSRSSEFEIEEDVMELILQGKSLSDAADKVYNTKNLAQGMGMSGVASSEHIPRSKLHLQPNLFTLAQCFKKMHQP